MSEPRNDPKPVEVSRRERPRTSDRADERNQMVKTQIVARGVDDPRVLQAMRDVPRHWFIPAAEQRSAYYDRPVPIGAGQTISQPFIVAHMTQLLELDAGEKVLEIGTGSGYQAAILSELTDAVYTIEIVESLGLQAARVFAEHGYENIHTRIGDGYRGWPEAAPFDAIIVTCAPEDIPQPLIDQLAPGGRLCIPVGPNDSRGQELIVVTRSSDGTLRRETKTAVRFVPMTGEAQGDR